MGVGGTVTAAVLALGTAAFYQGLVVRIYRVATSKWQRGRRLRFAVVSDLHCTVHGKGQKRLVELLLRQRPDFLLLPGDIVDQFASPAGAMLFLRQAPSIAPAYYSPGNHEYRCGYLDEILSMIRSCGVTVLANQWLALQTAAGPLLLAGCEDMEKRKQLDSSYDHAAALKGAFGAVADSAAYTLLMAHRPELYHLYRDLGFDLVVSGHAHGGQARIPFLCNGVIAPGQGLFPGYAGGCYRHGTMEHVVSRGTSVFRGLPRVFNPPEIVIVDVFGKG